MKKQKIQTFNVVGISVKTTNENEQSSKDIPALWQKFMEEGIHEKITNKLDNSIYCIYTDYEKDHTKPYTTILGCKVSTLKDIPQEMAGITFEEAEYFKQTVKGNLMEGIVYDAWTKIWNSDLNRAFTADFELYGEKAQNPGDAEVEIFVAIEPQ